METTTNTNPVQLNDTEKYVYNAIKLASKTYASYNYTAGDFIFADQVHGFIDGVITLNEFNDCLYSLSEKKIIFLGDDEFKMICNQQDDFFWQSELFEF